MRVLMFSRRIQVPVWFLAAVAGAIFGLGAVAGTDQRNGFPRDLTLVQLALPSGTTTYEAEMTVMTPALADMIGARDANGVFVNSVQCGGLQSGDVIVEINGNPVATIADLQTPLGIMTPGARANLGVVRDGIRTYVAVERAAAPAAVIIYPTPVIKSPVEEVGGAGIADLNPLLAEQMGLPPGARGIVVIGVNPSSPAGVAGVLPGDVIVGVNNVAVQTVGELKDTVWKMGLTPLVLAISRDGAAYLFTFPSG